MGSVDYTGSGIGLVGKFFIKNIILILFSCNKIWSNQQQQQKLIYSVRIIQTKQSKQKIQQEI